MGEQGYIPTFTDAEAAAEAGRLSGEARRRRAQLSPEERALEAIGSKLGRLTNELLDAALGEGDFATRLETLGENGERRQVLVPGLKPETRVAAILRAMEWKLGKAPTAKRADNETTPEVPTVEGLFSAPTPDPGDAGLAD